ncbi:SRPBCC domain-containing protein [Paenibacillus sp. FSL H8-0537]|uniref:SRPBCC family protein n=1 Tax=Paenibacillus sp. FSL H8-0537 TaxID=2921399 RepID=UPI00310136D5
MSSEAANTLPDIRQTLVLKAPIDKVWKAVATSEGIAAWFMPNDFQPEEGYEFQLEAGAFGKSSCKVTVIDPPNRLSFKWGKDWTLTFELKAVGEETEFTLIHGGWNEGTVTEFGQPHEIVRGHMDKGWTGIQQRLASYVESQ